MCIVDNSKGWWQNMSVFTLTGQAHTHTQTNTITIVHRCSRQWHRCVWKSVVHKSVGYQPTLLNQCWSGCFSWLGIRGLYQSNQSFHSRIPWFRPTISWIIYSHPLDGWLLIPLQTPTSTNDLIWPNLLKRNMTLWSLSHLSLVSNMKMARYTYHGQTSSITYIFRESISSNRVLTEQFIPL